MRGSRGGTGGPDPAEKLQKATLVRIPCKITKLLSQHSMLGHHRHAWRFAGGPMMAPKKYHFHTIWIRGNFAR